MAARTRVFRPVSPYLPGTRTLHEVDRWEYNRYSGLMVVYVSGFRCKAPCILGELLAPDSPRGPVVEITQP